MQYLVEKLGSEILVNTTTAGEQTEAVVTALPGGGFAVAWAHQLSGYDYQVRLQIFDAAGAKLGDEHIVLAEAVGGSRPAIAVLSDGRLAVTFDAKDIVESGDSQGIAGKILEVDEKTGAIASVADLAVNQHIGNSQAFSDLIALANGDFVVLWGDSDRAVGGSDMNGHHDLVGSIYDHDGVRQQGEFPVNFDMSENQSLSDGAGLEGGGFVAVWHDGAFSGSIKARRFNADGSPVATDFAVATSSGNDNGVNNPSVAALSGGGFIVTWNQGSDGANNIEIRAQIFDENGVEVGSRITVNTSSPYSQLDPAIAAFPDGRFVVAWVDDSRLSDDPSWAIRAQLFSAAGEKIGQELLVNTEVDDHQNQPEIAVLGDDRFVVTWRDPSERGTDTDGSGIKAQVFNITEGIIGDDDPNTLTGTPDEDNMFGGGSSDGLSGLGGGDTIDGGTGDDRLEGDAGNDDLIGGVGADTAAYSGWWKDYAVTQTQTGFRIVDKRSGSPDGMDTLASIEKLAFANGEVSIADALNDGPASSAIPNGTAREGTGFSFDAGAKFSDADESLGDELAFSASGLPSWLEINASTGVLSGMPGYADAAGARTITVTATDLSGASASRMFDLTVMNTNRAPTDISLSAAGIAENSAAGTVVATIATADPDGASGITFSERSDPDGKFTIVGNQLRLAGTLDFEQDISHSITVRATDPSGGTRDETFTVTVGDVADSNRAPTDISLSATSVAENSAAGTVIATISAADPDGASGITFSERADPDGKFVVVGNELRLAGDLDFEQDISHSITIRATDAAGGTRDETFTIAVGDIAVENDVVAGSARNDSYRGGAGKDKLDGAGGKDRLDGGSGNDALNGGGAKDKLTGGSGKDKLTGGKAADQFVFKAPKDSPSKKKADLITDFKQKQGDQIVLKKIDAKKGKGNQKFDFIGTEEFSGTKGELRFEKKGKKSFVYGDIDGDGKADFAIMLKGKIDLEKDDFFL